MRLAAHFVLSETSKAFYHSDKEHY